MGESHIETLPSAVRLEVFTGNRKMVDDSATKMEISDCMTIEEKRQVLYAAILRYSPEAGSLRERALDRLVLVALMESSSLAPLKIGQIQQLTRVAPGSPGLRMEIIHQALHRLWVSNSEFGR